MQARTQLAGIAVMLLGLTVAAVPGHAAKVCKDPLSATGSTRAQLSEASREKRALDNAMKNWSNKAKDTHGVLYRFWFRADDKTQECKDTPKTKRCTVTAKPCRVY